MVQHVHASIDKHSACTSWGLHMKSSVATAARWHIVELEARIAQQRSIVQPLLTADRDAVAATRTLRVLQDALALTKEQLRLVLRRHEAIGVATSQQTIC